MRGFRWRFVYAIALGVLYFPASFVSAEGSSSQVNGAEDTQVTFSIITSSGRHRPTTSTELINQPTTITGSLANHLE